VEFPWNCSKHIAQVIFEFWVRFIVENCKAGYFLFIKDAESPGDPSCSFIVSLKSQHFFHLQYNVTQITKAINPRTTLMLYKRTGLSLIDESDSLYLIYRSSELFGFILLYSKKYSRPLIFVTSMSSDLELSDPWRITDK